MTVSAHYLAGGEEPPARTGCAGATLFLAVALWALIVTFVLQYVAWNIDEVLMITGQPLPRIAWLLISLGHALLLALPIAPLALASRPSRFRAAYQTWALAVAYMVLVAPARLFASIESQPAMMMQILLNLIALLVLFALVRRRGHRLAGNLPGAAAGLGIGVIVILPYAIFGALGSPLDTLLALLAGLSFGLFAGLLVSTVLYASSAEETVRSSQQLTFTSLATTATLVILAGGFGFGGLQLPLLISLPPLGLLIAAWHHRAGIFTEDGRIDWMPLAAVLGLASTGPLLFFDPDELTLLLDGAETFGWATQSAGIALLIAVVIGALVRARAGWIGRPAPLPAVGLLLAAFAAFALVFFTAGQPGFYGERSFVILREQADLTAANEITDREERLAYVYATLTAHADATQSELREIIEGAGIAYTPYYLVNAIEVHADPLLAAFLEGRPEVDRVLLSQRLRPVPAPSATERAGAPAPDGPVWNIQAIGADRVWFELGVTGEGIIVGQSDSGVEGTHPALQARYRGGAGDHDYNWLDPWNGTQEPTETGGHGTFTLGTALGEGGIGVAPGAEWFACVNLARNLANPAFYLDCMQFMLAPYPQGGHPFTDGDPSRAAHVTNNSWGCPPIEGCDAGSLEAGVEALRAAGIFVSAAAGNNGPSCESVSDPPAIYAGTFSVGAVDRIGNVAPFSSRGPVTVDESGRMKPDIAAPGVGVLSSGPGGGYGTADGTSLAGPHVAGVVALMWSAQPALIGDIDRTEDILRETARPYEGELIGCVEGTRPNTATGYGILDAFAAVQRALAIE